MRTPITFQQVLAAHRERLGRLASGRGLSRLKKVYEQAEQELLSKIGRQNNRQKFTISHHAAMLAQVRQGQAVMARRTAGELGSISREAQVDSLRGLSTDIKRMEKHYTGTTPVLPVDEAARFSGVIDRRRTSLLRMHEGSMARYGGRLVGDMEDQMAVSVTMGETIGDAVDRIQQVAQNEWWQAERIARTETLWAYNATHADGIKEVATRMPQLMMRWTEHVSDDGAPLDDRVGEDSIVMHGQVAPPGGLFTMPPDPRASQSLWYKSWDHPPNRPNDRAVLVPWNSTWGVMAWRWSGGRRVDLR